MSTGESMMIDQIESALSMLRTDLVQRFAEGDWDEGHAEQAARAMVARLRPESDAAGDRAQVRNSRVHGEVIRRTLRYIDDNLDSKLTWQQLASRMGVDEFGIGRRFKQFTGMTPHQYVIRRRVRRAMELLEREELSIIDIALEVGCSCQSHLTTLFRKHTGTTPAAFRKAARFTRRPFEDEATSAPSLLQEF
jgi:transcriptional regulator GlxA family with amidase domain